MNRNTDTQSESDAEKMQRSLEKLRPIIREYVEHNEDAIKHEFSTQRVEYLMARQDGAVKEVAEDAPHREWVTDENVKFIEFKNDADADRARNNIKSQFGSHAHFKSVCELHEIAAGDMYQTVRRELSDTEFRTTSWDFLNRTFMVSA